MRLNTTYLGLILRRFEGMNTPDFPGVLLRGYHDVNRVVSPDIQTILERINKTFEEALQDLTYVGRQLIFGSNVYEPLQWELLLRLGFGESDLYPRAREVGTPMWVTFSSVGIQEAITQLISNRCLVGSKKAPTERSFNLLDYILAVNDHITETASLTPAVDPSIDPEDILMASSARQQEHLFHRNPFTEFYKGTILIELCRKIPEFKRMLDKQFGIDYEIAVQHIFKCILLLLKNSRSTLLEVDCSLSPDVCAFFDRLCCNDVVWLPEDQLNQLRHMPLFRVNSGQYSILSLGALFDLMCSTPFYSALLDKQSTDAAKQIDRSAQEHLQITILLDIIDRLIPNAQTVLSDSIPSVRGVSKPDAVVIKEEPQPDRVRLLGIEIKAGMISDRAKFSLDTRVFSEELKEKFVVALKKNGSPKYKGLAQVWRYFQSNQTEFRNQFNMLAPPVHLLSVLVTGDRTLSGTGVRDWLVKETHLNLGYEYPSIVVNLDTLISMSLNKASKHRNFLVMADKYLTALGASRGQSFEDYYHNNHEQLDSPDRVIEIWKRLGWDLTNWGI